MDPTATSLKGGPSRRVADMDVDKLYRKRAIDRENQRNLRSKNRHRIQQLQDEVCELKQKLEESQRETSRLSGQGMATRSTISSIIKSLQALEDESHPNSHEIGSEQRLDCSFIRAQPGLPNTDSPAFGPEDVLAVGGTLDSNLWSQGGSVSFADGNFSDLPDFSFDLSHLLPAFPTNTTNADSAVSQTAGEDSHPVSDHVFRAGRKLANTMRGEGHIWKHLPEYCSPTCNGDAWILNLIKARKDSRDVTKNATEFSNRNFPSINSLVNPSIAEPDTPVASTVAKNLTGIVRVYTLPEKIALLYVISHLLRWQIMPSEESYAAIPDFAKPTLTQIAVQHPCWVGTIGWPKARERIIQCMDYTEYPEFATAITCTFSINWEHGLNGIIEGHAHQGYKLSETFIEHITNIDNWTVGQKLVDLFPFLQGAVNVK